MSRRLPLWLWLLLALLPLAQAQDGELLYHPQKHKQHLEQMRAGWLEDLRWLATAKPDAAALKARIKDMEPLYDWQRAYYAQMFEVCSKELAEWERKQGQPVAENQLAYAAETVSQHMMAYMLQTQRITIGMDQPLSPTLPAEQLLADPKVPQIVKDRLRAMQEQAGLMRELSRKPAAQRQLSNVPLDLSDPFRRTSQGELFRWGLPTVSGRAPDLPQKPKKYGAGPDDFYLPHDAIAAADKHVILYDASGKDIVLGPTFEYEAALAKTFIAAALGDSKAVEVVPVTSIGELARAISSRKPRGRLGLWVIGHAGPYRFHVGGDSLPLKDLLPALRGAGTAVVCNTGCAFVQRDAKEEEALQGCLKGGEVLRLYGHRYITVDGETNTWDPQNPLCESYLIEGRLEPLRVDYRGQWDKAYRDTARPPEKP